MSLFRLLARFLVLVVLFEFVAVVPIVSGLLAWVMFLTPGAFLSFWRRGGGGRRVVGVGGGRLLIVPLLFLLEGGQSGVGRRRFFIRGHVHQMLLNLDERQGVFGSEVVDNVAMGVDQETEEKVAFGFILFQEPGEVLAVFVGRGFGELVELEPLRFKSCDKG